MEGLLPRALPRRGKQSCLSTVFPKSGRIWLLRNTPETSIALLLTREPHNAAFNELLIHQATSASKVHLVLSCLSRVLWGPSLPYLLSMDSVGSRRSRLLERCPHPSLNQAAICPAALPLSGHGSSPALNRVAYPFPPVYCH